MKSIASALAMLYLFIILKKNKADVGTINFWLFGKTWKNIQIKCWLLFGWIKDPVPYVLQFKLNRLVRGCKVDSNKIWDTCEEWRIRLGKIGCKIMQLELHWRVHPS